MPDKVPPHDDEVERATLSAMLMDSGAVAAALQILDPLDFSSKRHQLIFEAVRDLTDRGLTADILSVTESLKQKGRLEESGGAAYVADLTSLISSGANIEFYAEAVAGYSLRRALLRVAGDLRLKVFDESTESRIILEEAQQRILELNDNRQTLHYRSTRQIIPAAIDIIEKQYYSKQEYTGIPSGFKGLDTLTSGFHPQEFIIIGARPSRGKTAIALNMAAHISIHKKIPAAFFTLEMPDVALAQRLITSEARIDADKIRKKLLKESEFAKLVNTAGDISEAPLYIVDMPNMRLLDLRSQARRLRVQQKVEIIFIDYLGLIRLDNTATPKWDQISEISRSLKSLARELDIPLVTLVQLTREAEKEQPNLSAIRDSGAIEQDADLVMFLQWPDETAGKKKEEQKQETFKTEGVAVNLLLRKNRNGPTGDVALTFMRNYTKFESRAREESYSQ
ncbi:MAG: replicative DNA helicase [Treponema sp.]|jgi:replicative DNA helicase|nr:replicative DNA helicase [Treponema sp.]